MVGEGKKIYTHNIDEGHEHTRTCGHVRTYAHKTHANEFVEFFYCRFLFSSFFLICTKFAIRFFFLYFFSKSVVIIKIYLWISNFAVAHFCTEQLATPNDGIICATTRPVCVCMTPTAVAIVWKMAITVRSLMVCTINGHQYMTSKRSRPAKMPITMWMP